MYAHNQMDGKIVTLTTQSLVAAEPSDARAKLPETQFFESQTACGDSTVVKVDGKHYLISGFDDGVLTLMDLQKTNGKSVKRPVFQTRSDSEANTLDQQGYDQFHEQAYEHPDSIISVEANSSEGSESSPVKVVSASKDGSIYVWKILGPSTEDSLTYIADMMCDEPVTRAKWLGDKTIAVSTTHGSIFLLTLEKDD
jgi:WD40 repeat protein